MENLSVYVKYDASGSVDVEATMSELRGAVEAYAVLQKADLESVRTAVHAVFDTFKGTNINLPALANYAIAKLDVKPPQYQEVTDRILSYVRNAKGEFEISKGRNGGVRRISDKPAPAADVVAAE